MKKLLMTGLAALLFAALATGCQSDRHAGGSGKEKKTARKAAKKRSGRRDPADDMFFGVGSGAKAESFANEGLNRREQELLSDELRRQDDEMREIRRSHRDMDAGRAKRKEWVFGFKPFGSK